MTTNTPTLDDAEKAELRQVLTRANSCGLHNPHIGCTCLINRSNSCPCGEWSAACTPISLAGREYDENLDDKIDSFFEAIGKVSPEEERRNAKIEKQRKARIESFEKVRISFCVNAPKDKNGRLNEIDIKKEDISQLKRNAVRLATIQLRKTILDPGYTWRVSECHWRIQEIKPMYIWKCEKCTRDCSRCGQVYGSTELASGEVKLDAKK